MASSPQAGRKIVQPWVQSYFRAWHPKFFTHVISKIMHFFYMFCRMLKKTVLKSTCLNGSFTCSGLLGNGICRTTEPSITKTGFEQI